MRQEHRQLLLGCLERSENPPPPLGCKWGIGELEAIRDAEEHGPQYAPAAWFGAPVLEHERVRLLRALRDLEQNGLVVLWRKYGRRLSNVKLTPRGTQAARELRGAEGAKVPVDAEPTPCGVASDSAPSVAQ